MGVPDSKLKADKAWRSRNYDRLSTFIPKGYRDRWRTFAESRGMSLRSLIVEAVEFYITAPSPAPAPAPAPSPLPSPEAETAGESGDDF